MLAISPPFPLVVTVQEGTEDGRFRSLSADGKCHPFDERVSGGFGPAEGASCAVLKPLCDAIDAGDNIRAIIRGSGMNQDGQNSWHLLAQLRVVSELDSIRVQLCRPETPHMRVIEAHGDWNNGGRSSGNACLRRDNCQGSCCPRSSPSRIFKIEFWSS